jgi:YHS domain-containing protein
LYEVSDASLERASPLRGELLSALRTRRSKAAAAGGRKPLRVKSNERGTSPTIDPVCGMTVDPDETDFRSAGPAGVVAFCCEGCKRAYDRKPALYQT